MNTSQEERRQHVVSMRINFGLEDMNPDGDDLALQECYIKGTVSLDDLLNYARSYAAKHRTLAVLNNIKTAFDPPEDREAS